MKKLLLISLFSLCFIAAHSQRNILAIKKGNKTADRYWDGRFISFQLKNHEWRKGEITNIRNDSFYIRPTVIKYNLFGADTFHFSVSGYSFSDVYALPKKGFLIDYKNGRFEISGSGGHVHWYWIKSGWLFRVGGGGYATLNLVNQLIGGEVSLNDKRLVYAAGVFVAGVILKHLNSPVRRVGKKYNLQLIKLD